MVNSAVSTFWKQIINIDFCDKKEICSVTNQCKRHNMVTKHQWINIRL